jgi:hypothetical protein
MMNEALQLLARWNLCVTFSSKFVGQKVVSIINNQPASGVVSRGASFVRLEECNYSRRLCLKSSQKKSSAITEVGCSGQLLPKGKCFTAAKGVGRLSFCSLPFWYPIIFIFFFNSSDSRCCGSNRPNCLSQVPMLPLTGQLCVWVNPGK